jgi:hypothetical protein
MMHQMVGETETRRGPTKRRSASLIDIDKGTLRYRLISSLHNMTACKLESYHSISNYKAALVDSEQNLVLGHQIQPLVY